MESWSSFSSWFSESSSASCKVGLVLRKMPISS